MKVKYGNYRIREKSEWVKVEFDGDGFEGLDGIDELTDYELIRENVTLKSSKHPRKKPKLQSSIEYKESITDEAKPLEFTSKATEISLDKEELKKGTLVGTEYLAANVSSKKIKGQQKKAGKKHKKQKSKVPEKKFETQVVENVDSIEESKVDMSAWENCFVPQPVKKALSELGFSYPTQIQALTLPSAIRDRLDILGAAETGSGKTLAFGIPVIHFILEEKSLEENENEDQKSSKKPLRALVITPTRELAIQVWNHLRMVAKYTDIKIEVVVGGMSLQKQERLLRRNPDIVVATPGRLWNLIEEGNPHLNGLSEIRYLVIDEADRMVEQGHFEELKQILEIINKSGSSSRKTYVFSATLTLVHDAPKRIGLKRKKFEMTQEKKLENLAKIFGISEKYKVIDLSRKVGTVKSLTEARVHCSLEEKDIYLYCCLLTHPGRTLVFCNSINCVRRLKSILTILEYSPYHLHASMNQRQRLKNLERFASDSKGVLLATDVAARGLDITGIEHVIHYQVPRTAEIYVHRSGRTARAEREGHSLMLIEPKEITYYKRLCNVLNRDKDLPLFQVDHSLLHAVKERISLAKMIDKLEHSARKSMAEKNWLEKSAREMEVEIDDELKPVKPHKKELAALKKRLKMAIRRPVLKRR